MIRLGAQLTLRGGREALTRLLVIVAAVAVGVTLLLATLATLNAVHAQNDRYAWLNTGAPGVARAHATGRIAADPVWWRITADEFQGRRIARVDVAATGPDSPIPPGVTRLPGPGEYEASPALTAVLRSVPADELAARYPGRLVATIGAAALPAPDSLVIIVGEPVGQLAHASGAELVDAISTTPPDQCAGPCYDVGLNSASLNLILAVVTAAILFPVLIFIGTATRLSAARREQRFAALRLVGATPPQITVLSAIESTLASAAGMLAGFGLFYAVRPLLAQVPFTGARFFAGDLSLDTADVLLVGLGVPLGAAFAAWVALRRVIVSPLGVARRVTSSAPRAWRLLPLLTGLGELAYFVLAGRPATVGGQILAYTAGVVITLGGLVMAGPWLTMIGARALAHRARRPATLIAARRLADNPKAGFRAISGLVVGLFVATVAYGVVSTFTFYRGGTTADSAADRATLVDQLVDYSPSGIRTPVQSVPSAVQHEFAATRGVRGVLVVHAAGERPGPDMQGVVSCAQLAAVPVLGRCPSGAAAATVSPGFGTPGFDDHEGTVWPASTLSPASLAREPVAAVVVATDGSTSAIERSRTVLEKAFPQQRDFAPVTISEGHAQSEDAQRNAGYERLADIVIITSLPIAGCTLAVSVVAGLNDRRRPFSLLRLTGAPLATLRRVVALESSVPLLLSAAVAVGTGLLTAFLFLRSQLSETLLAPGVEYYGVVVAGLLASLAIIASTMPVLARITGPEAARDD